MTDSGAIPIESFSHVCIGVSDTAASLAFYTGLLGMDVVFDVALDGSSLDSVTGLNDGSGRMVGGLIGGTMVELLALGAVPAVPTGAHLGYTNVSFRVRDLTAVHEMLQQRSEVRSTPPVDIGGVRMLFVYDPDRTPIEFIELPDGVQSTLQMWRPRP